MKILITGGCGYKGSVLIPALLEQGHEVTSVDTQWFGNYLPEHENLENLKEKEVIDFFNVNLLAHILISKVLVSHFKKKKTGHFIFIGSEASLKGNQKSTLYSAAKHGLLGFVKSFREECNKSDIRVTIINPGMVNSSFFKKLKFSPGKSIKNSIKLEDIAELVFFILKSNRNINYNDIYLSPIKKVINFKNN